MSNCGNSSSSSLINFCKKNIGRRPGSCRGVKAELYPRTRGEFSAGKAAGRAVSLRQRLTGCLGSSQSSQPYGGDSMELPARPIRSASHSHSQGGNMKMVSFSPHCQSSPPTASRAVMCRERRERDTESERPERQHTRAYSELPPVKMALASQLSRATSIGPIWGLSRKPAAARDPPGLYESNYESLDSCSNGSNDNSDSSKAIQKLESAVKSIDHLIFPSSKAKPGGSKIQYDCITVLPPVLPPPPPPPLPRTRSFKHYRARTVFPGPGGPQGQQASSLPSHSEPGRAASAPPISPLTGRRCLYWDR